MYNHRIAYDNRFKTVNPKKQNWFERSLNLKRKFHGFKLMGK